MEQHAGPVGSAGGRAPAGRDGAAEPTRPYGDVALIIGCPWPECAWRYFADQADHAHRMRPAFDRHYRTHVEEQLQLEPAGQLFEI